MVRDISVPITNKLNIVLGLKRHLSTVLRIKNAARTKIIEIQGRKIITFRVGLPTELITGCMIYLIAKAA